MSTISSRRQKRMGPAPFASFEDLSDEVRSYLDSPEEKDSIVRLPGIKEDVTPVSPAPPGHPVSPEIICEGINLIGTSSMTSPQASQANTNKMTLQTPNTPRIDISRASSSSQHEDSRDSTPERELFEGQDPAAAKLGLGFREEGTLDLRSSTEELDFQDPQLKQKAGKTCPQSPCLDSQSYLQRKDSQSSEIGLLSISGRTSRLSSIGSQGSAQSRISNASHLSVLSGQSGFSRSPSPHKMLLETSFCGVKSQEDLRKIVDESKQQPEELEKMILARKHDPTKAILAEGINVNTQKGAPEKPARKNDVKGTPQSAVKSDITIKVDKPEASAAANAAAAGARPKLPKTIVSSSGVEYTYIPLKGPLPEDPDAPSTSSQPKVRLREPRSTQVKPSSTQQLRHKSQQSSSSSSQRSSHKSKSPSSPHIPMSSVKGDDLEPVYIRIKLKPDHMYDDSGNANAELQKPDSLNLNLVEATKKPAQTFAQLMEKEHNKIETITTTSTTTTTRLDDKNKSITSTPSASPKIAKNNFLREANVSSKSPSPSLSRKSSFCSLFKSKEGILSPDSPTGVKRKNTLTGIFKDASDNLRERRRSRSKSRERSKTPTNVSIGPSSTESIDSKGKPKSVFSLFKGGSKKEEKQQEQGNHVSGLENLEFTFNDKKTKHYHEKPLEAESIRIPLHSPTYYENRSMLQDLKTSSQDSQETVIEASTRNQVAVEEVEIQETNVEVCVNVNVNENEENAAKAVQVVHQQIKQNSVVKKQESVTSENVVFTTKLGSSDEIFSTKLPTKESKPREKEEKELISSKRTSLEGKEEVKEVCVKKIPPGPPLRRSPSIKKSFVSNNKGGERQRNSQPPSRDKTPSKETTPVQESVCKIASRDGSVPSLDLKLQQQAVAVTPSGQEVQVIGKKVELVQEIVQNISIPPSVEECFVNEVKRKLERNSLVGVQDEDRYSSGSEKDSEKMESLEVIEPERKGLVLQQDSFEDEFPYIPTTLPQERSVAVPIVPIKQRANIDIRTCPIERPRSTTPIIPSSLEGYAEEAYASSSQETTPKTIEKLKICLPRDEAERSKSQKSPRKKNGNWFEFPDKSTQAAQKSTSDVDVTPPPLPPKGVLKEWINFEEIPEKRKPPKRIQTIPSRGTIDVPESILQENVVYNYVNPEDCKCECHELSARERDKRERDKDKDKDKDKRKAENDDKDDNDNEEVQEDELPLLEEDGGDESEKAPASSMDHIKLDVTIIDRTSIISDSSVDLSTCVENSEHSGVNDSLQTPFTSDLGMSSNRSSIISQEDSQSPESISPNAFPKQI